MKSHLSIRIGVKRNDIILDSTQFTHVNDYQNQISKRGSQKKTQIN